LGVETIRPRERTVPHPPCQRLSSPGSICPPSAGYPDGNDCDALRADPGFKMAVGRLLESGGEL
jgi:hypothetical protein